MLKKGRQKLSESFNIEKLLTDVGSAKIYLEKNLNSDEIKKLVQFDRRNVIDLDSDEASGADSKAEMRHPSFERDTSVSVVH